jgi:hypothetical protein
MEPFVDALCKVERMALRLSTSLMDLSKNERKKIFDEVVIRLLDATFVYQTDPKHLVSATVYNPYNIGDIYFEVNEPEEIFSNSDLIRVLEKNSKDPKSIIIANRELYSKLKEKFKDDLPDWIIRKSLQKKFREPDQYLSNILSALIQLKDDPQIARLNYKQSTLLLMCFLKYSPECKFDTASISDSQTLEVNSIVNNVKQFIINIEKQKNEILEDYNFIIFANSPWMIRDILINSNDFEKVKKRLIHIKKTTSAILKTPEICESGITETEVIKIAYRLGSDISKIKSFIKNAFYLYQQLIEDPKYAYFASREFLIREAVLEYPSDPGARLDKLLVKIKDQKQEDAQNGVRRPEYVYYRLAR